MMNVVAPPTKLIVLKGNWNNSPSMITIFFRYSLSFTAEDYIKYCSLNLLLQIKLKYDEL